MNAFSLSGLLIFLTSFFFSLLFFTRGNKGSGHKLWAFFCFSVAVWGLGGFFIGETTNPGTALIWWKITHVGVIFIPVFFWHYVYIFLGIKRPKTIITVYVSGFIFLFASLFTDKFISNVRWVFDSFYYDSPPSYVYYLFVVFFFAAILYSHFELYKALKNSSGLKKTQIKYFFIATLVGFSGGTTSFLPVFNINIYPFLNFSVPLYPIIMTYAIIAHRLMDVKLVLRRSTVFIFSIVSIAVPAFFIKLALYNIFDTTSNVIDMTILIVAISLFPPIKDYYYRLANKHFFSSLYDTKSVIEKVSDELSSTLEIKYIYGFVSDTLVNTMHIKSMGILTYSVKKKEYVLQHSVGLNTSKQRNFKDDANLQKDFADQSNPIIVEELKSVAYNRYKKTIDLLESLGIEVLVPLDVKGKPIGLMVLGAKESGDIYNEDDLGVLKIVGAQMAISLENALLYEKTRSFNKKLRQEVEVATADLLAANEKLKKLDAAKSEFISIASHQLRTPLTAIKGYISMMLEGDFGTLTQPEHDSLEKVFESNERLIKLVENLLNVSRIESGRLQFNFEEVQLEKMVESVMDELSGHAKKKDLRLEYVKPDHELPKVNIDDEKIRQVVMNLIDNSIKYTKKGTVTVSLKQDGNNIEFCVSDTGMGVSPQDLPNLFQKFSRGTGTSLVHTEGTGLGLFVARQMMEAHHGTIWAESKGEGLGSKFCFKLPIIQQPAAQPATAQ